MDNLKELAAEKEREWRQVQEMRIVSLETAIADKEKILKEERAKFQELKNDFKFNLKLLAERDAELDKYDTEMSVFRSTLASRDGEISDLKIQVDNLRQQLVASAKEREEMTLHCQHRIREKQLEMDEYKSKNDAELQQERNELAAQHRQLLRQVKELEDAKEVEKRQLATAFEDAMRKREHESRKQADEMSVSVLAHDMKVKLLSKEVELAKASEQSHRQRFEEMENNARELEKKLKQKEWELADVTTMKDVMFREFEAKRKDLEALNSKLQEELQRKRAESERQTMEHETQVGRLNSAAAADFERLQRQLETTEARLSETQAQCRVMARNLEETTAEKDGKIEQLERDLHTVRMEWERNLTQMAQDNVARDVELRALRDAESAMKMELAQRRADVDRYRQELSAAAEREQRAERAKVQLELDWQRRLDDVERQQLEKAEELIRRISTARDEALAEVEEKEREIRHHCAMVDVLRDERARAIAVLQQHGIVIDRTLNVPLGTDIPKSAADYMSELQQQNTSLRQVVHEMRTQMEMMGDANVDSPPPAVTPREQPRTTNEDGYTAEYVKSLESEVKQLKSRLAEGQFAAISGGGEAAKDQNVPPPTDNTIIKSHLEQLNTIIVKLRNEKVDLTTQLKKQQVRIQHLESGLHQMVEEPKKKQVQCEQLQYEVATLQRRHQAEVASLKDTVSDLRLRLEQAQKESDEYHKVMVDRSIEVNALNKEISDLKVQLAQASPGISFGAQELVIQQLQDEISHLYQQHDHLYGPDKVKDAAPGDSDGGRKLKAALHHIRQLTREKQQLIDLGNRMRAELNKHGIALPASGKHAAAAVVTAHPSSAQPVSGGRGQLQEKLHNKLQQLQQLQYELTRQQLAVCHQTEVTQVSDKIVANDDNEDSDDWQPKSILKTKGASIPSDELVDKSRVDGATKLAQVSDKVGGASNKVGGTNNRRSGRSEEKVLGGGDLPLLSSDGGESLQDVWRLLDDSATTPRPSTAPTRGVTRPVSGDNAEMSVRGTKAVPRDARPAASVPGPATSRMVTSVADRTRRRPKKSPVRNWNVKDDVVLR